MKNILAAIYVMILFSGPAMAVDKQKIIFDCDLGSDIDDAYALALILASPEFEVLGIVLEDGNTPLRAQLACKMLFESGRREIPVIVGEKTSDNIEAQFSWAEGFETIKPSTRGATEFIIENLTKYPNEIILITVGPVTNMKKVIEKDPGVLRLAKHIYSMFGSFYSGYSMGPVPSDEWNVLANVDASKLFASCGASITFAGLDITMLVRLDEVNRNKLAMHQIPLTNALTGLYSLWSYGFDNKPDPVLHDVLAVGMVLWPELFGTRKAFVKVTGEGYTVIDESKDPNCSIGMTVNADELIRRYMERLMK